MELTSIQRLCAHLNRFHPVLLEQDRSVIRQLFSMQSLPSEDKSLDLQTLYLVHRSDPEQLLRRKASFLICRSDTESVLKLLGPQTNAVIVPEDCDVQALTQALEGYFSASERFRRFSSFLLADSGNHSNLQNHLRLFADFTGHPVAVLDSGLHIIADSGCEQPALFSQVLPGGSAQNLDPEAFRYPVLVNRPGFPAQIVVSMTGNSAETYLMQILEGSASFTDADPVFVSMVASVLRIHLSPEHRPERQDSIETLIQDVITGQETDPHRIFGRAQSLNFLLGSTNYLMVIGADSGLGFRRTMQAVHELQDMTPYTTVLLGSEIVMLLTGSKAMDCAMQELLPYFETHSGFKVSLSAVFSGIPLMKNAYEQCRAARELGSVLSPNGVWFDYEAYRELHFTNHNLTDADVDFFCLPVAREIVQHDRIHKTRYAYTLMLYIKNFKNAATVARIMNIHRNTMFYRLEKIAEQFQIHYDNPVQMNNLSLSFNILASRYPDIFN